MEISDICTVTISTMALNTYFFLDEIFLKLCDEVLHKRSWYSPMLLCLSKRTIPKEPWAMRDLYEGPAFRYKTIIGLSNYFQNLHKNALKGCIGVRGLLVVAVTA